MAKTITQQSLVSAFNRTLELPINNNGVDNKLNGGQIEDYLFTELGKSENLIINPEGDTNFSALNNGNPFDDTPALCGAKWWATSNGSTGIGISTAIAGRYDIKSFQKMNLSVYNAASKIAIYQFIENFFTSRFVNFGKLSLSFSAWTGGAYSLNLKYFVLGWTGTTDAVTLDPITSWNAQGVSPTFTTNYNILSQGFITLTSTPQTIKTENITISGSNNNLIICFVSDSDFVNTSNYIGISAVKIEAKTSSTAYIRRMTAIEDILTEKYFINVQKIASDTCNGWASTTSDIIFRYRKNGKMFKTPSQITSTPNIVVQNITAGGAALSSATATLTCSDNNGYLLLIYSAITGSPLTANNYYSLNQLTPNSAYIVADCYI